jgi:hypothetical protein
MYLAQCLNGWSDWSDFRNMHSQRWYLGALILVFKIRPPVLEELNDRQTDTHTHRQKEGIHRGGGSREWSILIPKLLAITRSLDKKRKRERNTFSNGLVHYFQQQQQQQQYCIQQQLHCPVVIQPPPSKLLLHSSQLPFNLAPPRTHD